MRVLIAHNRYRSEGGEERHVSLLEQGLYDAGVETAVFDPSNTALDSSRFKRARAGLTLVYNPGGGGIGDVLASWKPDVVHFHNIWPLLTPAALRLAKRSGASTVLTLHNSRLGCPAGTCSIRNHPASAGLYRNACIAGSSLRCALVNNPRGSLVESAAYGLALEIHRRFHLVSRWVDAFTAPSEYIRRMAVLSGAPRARVHLVPHGVPLEPNDRREARFVLYAGRLSEEKGVRTLLSASRLVPGVPLAIAGGGPLEPELEGAPVEYLGRLAHEDVGSALRRSAFAVVPSECHESFSYAVLEAFARGRPVVGSEVGGVPELVRTGETGVLVPPRSPERLAAALESLWNDPASTARMGLAARRVARSDYTFERQLGRTLSVYDLVRSSSGRRQPRKGVAAELASGRR
jgi:glycosyltransferase involved in cell wall biosynthesis